MKKILLFVAALAMAGTMTSCNKKMINTNSPVYSLEQTDVSNGYLETDLEVKGRLEGEVSGKFCLFTQKIKGNKHSYVMDKNTRSIPRGLNAAKAAARYKALKNSGCDILLAPIYTVTTQGRKFTIKVVGFGANIKDVKQKECTPALKDVN